MVAGVTCRRHPSGCTLGILNHTVGTRGVAGISHSRCLILTHNCSEEDATLNFLSFSEHEKQNRNIVGEGKEREEMRMSVLSSLKRKELTPGPGKRCCPISLGWGGGTGPQEPHRSRRLKDCGGASPVTTAAEKPAVPPGMTLEGQPIRRQAAAGAATSEETPASLARPAGLPCHLRGGAAHQLPDTSSAFLCTF